MNTALFAPLFAQVFFTVVLVLAMGGARFFAMTSGATKGRDLALGQKGWPERVQRISNAANNQWESPVLFYAGILLALLTAVADPLVVTLAWIYVATRLVHAAIYIAVNHVLSRFLVFGAGLLALLAFWIVLAIELLR